MSEVAVWDFRFCVWRKIEKKKKLNIVLRFLKLPSFSNVNSGDQFSTHTKLTTMKRRTLSLSKYTHSRFIELQGKPASEPLAFFFWFVWVYFRQYSLQLMLHPVWKRVTWLKGSCCVAKLLWILLMGFLQLASRTRQKHRVNAMFSVSGADTRQTIHIGRVRCFESQLTWLARFISLNSIYKAEL